MIFRTASNTRSSAERAVLARREHARVDREEEKADRERENISGPVGEKLPGNPPDVVEHRRPLYSRPIDRCASAWSVHICPRSKPRLLFFPSCSATRCPRLVSQRRMCRIRPTRARLRMAATSHMSREEGAAARVARSWALLLAGARMILRAKKAIASSDLVHLHSNGLLIEAGAWLARRFGKPYIVTLYGTDVSAHDPIPQCAVWQSGAGSVRARLLQPRAARSCVASSDLAPDPSSVIYAPVSCGFSSGR